MKIYRPDDGFILRFTPKAREQLAAITLIDTTHGRRVEGLLERIKLVGHVEGDAIDEAQPFLDRVISDAERDRHVISILYGLLGDTATIKSITTFNWTPN